MIYPTLHEVRSKSTMGAVRCYERKKSCSTGPLEVAEDLSLLRILVYSCCFQFINTCVFDANRSDTVSSTDMSTDIKFKYVIGTLQNVKKLDLEH